MKMGQIASWILVARASACATKTCSATSPSQIDIASDFPHWYRLPANTIRLAINDAIMASHFQPF
jgi:hypothetical protein